MKSHVIRAVTDRHRNLDADQLVELDSVVVEIIHMAIGAGLQTAQCLTCHQFRSVQQFVEQRQQFVASEAAGKFAQAPRADRAGGDLCVESPISTSGRRTFCRSIAISVVVQRVAAAELQQRDADAFLDRSPSHWSASSPAPCRRHPGDASSPR